MPQAATAERRMLHETSPHLGRARPAAGVGRGAGRALLPDSVERRGDRIMHRESQRDAQGQVLNSQEEEAAFAIGSGGRGLSYGINRDGYLFQSPISWFSQKERWDLSPGYQNRDSHFGRPLMPACLFCH